MQSTRWAGGIGLGCATALLGACAGMGDNSNPTLSIERATVNASSAALHVLVVNPGNHDLTLTAIDYELVLGPLPVASGSYNGSHALPPEGSANFNLRIPFDQPALDPDAGELSLTGVMRFEDKSAAGNMSITSASFEASAPVQ